jgi:hypothetical protein
MRTSFGLTSLLRCNAASSMTKSYRLYSSSAGNAASTSAPAKPVPNFTVNKQPEWWDKDGFAHPLLRNSFAGVDKHNKLKWGPFIPNITAVWLYRPEHSGSGQASSALLKVIKVFCLR